MNSKTWPTAPSVAAHASRWLLGRWPAARAGLAPSWGRFPERLSDGRGQATHLRHG